MMTFPHARLERVIDEFEGGIGVYVKDLATHQIWEHGADQRFPNASVCKVAVMVELFRRAEEGSLSLLDRHRLQQPAPPLGQPSLSFMKDEPELSLGDYCRIMINRSDNAAADFLIRLLTPARINATMEALGFHDTRTNFTIAEWSLVMRGVSVAELAAGDLEPVLPDRPFDRDSLAYSDSLENNVTTARDQGRIMEQLFYGQLISPKASSQMLEILKNTHKNNKLRRIVDYDTIVAHKTGGSNRVQADSGMAFLPSGPLIVCVLTLADDSKYPGVAAIERIGRLAVDALSPQTVASPA